MLRDLLNLSFPLSSPISACYIYVYICYIYLQRHNLVIASRLLFNFQQYKILLLLLLLLFCLGHYYYDYYYYYYMAVVASQKSINIIQTHTCTCTHNTLEYENAACFLAVKQNTNEKLLLNMRLFISAVIPFAFVVVSMSLTAALTAVPDSPLLSERAQSIEPTRALSLYLSLTRS